MPRLFWTLLIAGSALAASPATVAADPAETMRQSEQVLSELIAIPGKQIPHRLLQEAQGIAIIPRVIKIGFVAGARRGHGVVLVRDAEGEWSLPQFIRLTGGSVGWQAGIQGTDVVLVFKSRRSVEGLLKGKFTIGADAAAAAGPVGRNAAAATDASLQAEILSYSRSRGLFLGVSIDGSVLEIDQTAHTAFYGSPSSQLPQVVPPSATSLQAYIVALTHPATPAVAGAPDVAPTTEVTALRLDALRRALVLNASQLQAILSPEWKQYLAIPAETLDINATPNNDNLIELSKRFELINGSADYRQLSERPEFQTTFELLREYLSATAGSTPTLQLPQPPAAAQRR